MGIFKCKTCNSEISPEWVFAIKSNTCPGCGGEIMNKASEEFVKELAEALEKMPNNPAGLAGWIVSNYKLEKIGNCEPVEFKTKQAQTDNGTNKVATMSKFFKNAGMSEEKIRDIEKARKKVLSGQNELLIDDNVDSDVDDGDISNITEYINGLVSDDDPLANIGSGYNNSQVAKARFLLEEQQMKKDKAAESLSFGVGGFKRG